MLLFLGNGISRITTIIHQSEYSSCLNRVYFFKTQHHRVVAQQEKCIDIVSTPNASQSFEGHLKTWHSSANYKVTLDITDIQSWVDIILYSIATPKDNYLDHNYVYQWLRITGNVSTLIEPEKVDGLIKDALLFYLDAFNRSRHQIQLAINVKYTSCCKKLELIMKNRSYTWYNEIFLTNENPGHIISLPGFDMNYQTTFWAVNKTNNSDSSVLKIYWVQNLNQYFTEGNEIYLCYGFICINYSSGVDLRGTKAPKPVTEHYYIYLVHWLMIDLHLGKTEIINFDNYGQISLNISWNQASELCEKINGTLPIVRSKKQQDEIMAILTSRATPPPIVLLFIGLASASHQGKVNNSQNSSFAIVLVFH